MKVRNSFVTNSSSSSFILALKEGVEKEDLKKDLEKFYDKNRDEIIDCIEYYKEFFEDYGEPEEDEDKNLKDIVSALSTHNTSLLKTRVVDFLSEEILDFFNNSFYSPRKLNDWFLGIEECSNDSGELFSDIMYEAGGNFDGENLKMI